MITSTSTVFHVQDLSSTMIHLALKYSFFRFIEVATFLLIFQRNENFDNIFVLYITLHLFIKTSKEPYNHKHIYSQYSSKSVSESTQYYQDNIQKWRSYVCTSLNVHKMPTCPYSLLFTEICVKLTFYKNAKQ